MKACNRYELDGEILEIPLRWDQRTQAYVEDYGDYIDQPAYTPAGRPILLTIEDACPHADMGDSPGGIDCGACGAPSCRAFAEDLVRGVADPKACVVASCEKLMKYLLEINPAGFGNVAHSGKSEQEADSADQTSENRGEKKE